MRTSSRKSLWGYLFIAPHLSLFLVFLFLPVLLAFLLAFREVSVIRFEGSADFFRFLVSDYIGWRNFSDAFAEPVFYSALRNTLLYTLVMVPLSVGLSLLLALLIIPLNERLQGLFRGAYYLPSMFSGVILALLWRWIYEPKNGILNLALDALGVQGPNWLGDPKIALASILVSAAVYAPGLGVIIYSAAISRIPDELLEAAHMDGASTLQKWRSVVIPLLKPTTLFLVVINTIWSFQVFTSIYIMTRGGPGDSTTTLVYFIYDLAFKQVGRKGEAAAVSFILFAMVAIVAFIQFRMLRSEAEY